MRITQLKTKKNDVEITQNFGKEFQTSPQDSLDIIAIHGKEKGFTELEIESDYGHWLQITLAEVKQTRNGSLRRTAQYMSLSKDHALKLAENILKIATSMK